MKRLREIFPGWLRPEALSAFLDELVRAYGALYLVAGRPAALLLVGATLVQPVPGLIGFAGGALALGVRRALALPAPRGNLDVMNAVFVSLLLAKTHAPSPRLVGFVALAAFLTVLAMQMAERLLGERARLPVLSLPYTLVSWMMAALAYSVGLAPHGAASVPPPVMPAALEHMLATFGALYFSPDWKGGMLVLTAFVLSSPILTGLGVAGYLLAELSLFGLTGSDASPLRMLVGYNGIVTAMVVGGILGVPRGGQLLIAMLAVLVSVVVALAATSLLSIFWLSALSLPFVSATYLSIAVFRGARAPAWASHWRSMPALPETVLAKARQAEVRGIEADSIGLCLPYAGQWHVYQGFDGPHAHQGAWRHGVDFIRMEDGRSYCGKGERLEDYLCFNEAVLSPVFGTVVALRSDIPDNRPGDVNTRDNWGNHVMIAVAGGKFVVVAHLRQHSVLPAIGAFVYPGMLIGRCGNSGRSPQPHIHLHVQDSAILGAPTRPFYLSNLLRSTSEGPEFSLNLEPCEGQALSPASASPALSEVLRPRVGQTMRYRVEWNGRLPATWSAALELDLAGRFLLRASGGASAILHETPLLRAFDSEPGRPDPVLASFVLALGITPYDEQALHWRDAQPISLLRLSIQDRLLVALARPFGGALDSRYSRRWEPAAKRWLQQGSHCVRLGAWTVARRETLAWVCERDGVTAFSLLNQGKPEFTARLTARGCRGDIGIPGWSVTTESADTLPQAILEHEGKAA